METIIIEVEGQMAEQIKAYLQEMKVSFKTKITNEKPYDPEFVKMVLEASNSNHRRVLDDEYKKELFG
jgi:hypothetical protein